MKQPPREELRSLPKQITGAVYSDYITIKILGVDKPIDISVS